MDPNVRYLTNEEVDTFLTELDTDNDGVIEYHEVEAKLDQVFQELGPATCHSQMNSRL